MSRTSKTFFGKYRSIIIVAVFFVGVDLAVLLFNYYTSFAIDGALTARDLSGRQRSTSQRVARALLELDADRALGKPASPDLLAEVRDGAKVIQTTHLAFLQGGPTTSADGKPIVLEAIDSPKGREALDQFTHLWDPYYQRLQPILKSDDFSGEVLDSAVSYSRVENRDLLKAANGLVAETQRLAGSKGRILRTIQTVGLLLAIISFIYRMVVSVKQLAESDREVARAQKETDEILGTVKEGLFLLDPQLRIGEQRSGSLKTVLQREVPAQADFVGMLSEMVPAETLRSSKDYLTLLFGNRVKEGLITSLNPLAEVEVRLHRDGASARTRYLSFQFNRVVEDGAVARLLVTVQDATERVRLAAQLANAKGQARIELDLLLRLLNTDPGALARFLDDAERALAAINTRLKNAAARSSDGYEELVDFTFRKIHGIKGEAAALGLEMFEALAHAFEEDLQLLRRQDGIDGADMVKLTVRLDEFYERIGSVRGISERLQGHARAGAPAGNRSREFVEPLRSLTERVADSERKQVRLTTEVDALDKLPEPLAAELRNIAIQLLRNSITHGIEAPAERSLAAKSAVGNVHVACRELKPGEYEFTFRDDGRGLNPARIRQALANAGKLGRDEIAALSDRQVVMKIFEPGFSTAERVDENSGRGFGMDVVREKIRAIGGQMRLSSQPNQFTEFNIRFGQALPAA